MRSADRRGFGATAVTVSAEGRVLYTIDEAAPMLATTPTALRARCRRSARREGREVVARLGAGVVGFKFGRNWRVRFSAG